MQLENQREQLLTRIRAETEHQNISETITIVGRSDLADRYEIALKKIGLGSRRAPNDIVARGHFLIARSAGLLS